MDMIFLILAGLGAIGAAVALGGGGGGDDDPTPAESGRTEPGEGGYGPDGTYDRVWGTSGENLLQGIGSNNEIFLGYDGYDTIEAGAGNDNVFAYKGDDLIEGGAGDDRIFGGNGKDIVDGGFIAGTFGDPEAFKDGLEARLLAGDFELTEDERDAAIALGLVDVQEDLNDDFIRGENGNDILADALGSNTFHGDLANDLIFALDAGDPTANADTVYGGYGADTIFADNGDEVSGGEGVDHFHIFAGANEIADDTSEAAVTITDFDPVHEQLVIDNLDEGYGAFDSATFVDDATGTFVQVGGVSVAYLNGVFAADIPSGAVIVTAPPT